MEYVLATMQSHSAFVTISGQDQIAPFLFAQPLKNFQTLTFLAQATVPVLRMARVSVRRIMMVMIVTF